MPQWSLPSSIRQCQIILFLELGTEKSFQFFTKCSLREHFLNEIERFQFITDSIKQRRYLNSVDCRTSLLLTVSNLKP